jgi:hypothetical protein
MRPLSRFTASLISAAFFAASSYGAWYSGDVGAGDRDTNLYLSANAGINSPQKGFDNYKNYLYAGADLYFIPEGDLAALEGYNWRDNFFYRASFDYILLDVPDGTNGTSEDLFALSFDLLYSVYKGEKTGLFIGIGIGGYYDFVSVDTPATGKVSASYFNLGYRPCVAFPIRVGRDTELVPEARFHNIFYSSGYYPSLVTYHLGLRFKL